MNQTTPEITPEVKNVQVQTEPSPVIKSEENQANWKAFREQREAEKKAREASEKLAAQKAEEVSALKAALEASMSIRQSHHAEEQDETEEAKIDRRVKQIIEERERIAEIEKQKKEVTELPQKLNSVFGDFNKVCTEENLDYLEFHYPEIAIPFKHMPDGFDKWSAIYKTIKRFIPNTDSHKDASKADRNLQKPTSLATPGATQGSSAMPTARLTEERKAENWARMERARKGIN